MQTKKFLSVLLAVIMVIGLVPGTVFAAEETSAVTEIATVADLQAFAAAVNAGDNFAGKKVVLANDIEVNDYWFNNETGVDFRITKDFAGTFDGQRYSIKGLQFQNTDITKNPTMYLFSSISGTVKNLTLDGVDADINDRDCFGFIAYNLTGTADNCHVKNVTVDVAVNAKGTGYMYQSGAMFGNIRSATVINCSASNVKFIPTGTDNSDNVGALIGYATGTETARSTIKDCSVTDFTLDATRKTKRTGGFVGNTGYTDVSGCSATNITFNVDNYAQTVGGFVGAAGTGSTFTSCAVENFKLSNADDARYPADAGGFCAYAGNASFIDCSVTNLDIDLACNDANYSWLVGGFLGYASGAVNAENCTVSGDIDVTGTSPANQTIGSFVATNNDQNVTTDDCTSNIEAPFNGATTGIAKIGENYFATLDAAITKAQAGETITLQADIEITESTTFTMAEGVTLDLNGYTIKGDDGKAIFTGTNITIKNGTVTGYNGSTLDYYPITIDGGSATLENLTFTSSGVKIRNSAVVTLKNNSITANQNKYKYAVWAYGKANVTIESGTYFGGKNGYDVFQEGGAKITLYGGTYKVKNNEGYVATDYRYVRNEDGYYTVMPPYVEAIVNGTSYDSLQAAIDAANANDTVYLMVDITVAEQIVINKSITLDLGKYTITGATDTVLRIYSAVADTVINVTIDATTGGIKNTGAGYAIYAGEDIAEGNDEERTNLSINGGVYETAGTDCIRQIIGLCTINGGSYKSSYGRTVLNGKRWYGSEFAINGGTFYEFNPACVSVWTGFEGNNWDNFYHQHDIIAEGKTATYADGWYTVVDGTYTAVAKTTSLCYPSVEAALNASINLNDVANLGTITLQANDTLDLDGETIELPKGLVIDLNGHTLTVPYQKTRFAGENITIKNGTITTGENKNYALYIMSGSFAVENVTVEGGINVQGGNVNLKDVNAANRTSRYYAVYAGDEANVIIESGTFKNDHSSATTTVYGNVTIYSGTFSKMPPAEMLAANRHVVMGSSAYTVYEGFLNALAAAEAGDTVYLMSDIEVAETIIIDKAITLDLGANTITSTAAKNVIYSTADLTINATEGGIYSETARTAILQDNGVCTINGGFFKASGETGDHANGKPVYNTLVLNNTDFYEGVTGSFVINDGKFFMFNPGCVSINKHDHRNHEQIADGKIATLDADGWFTVTEGEFAYKVVCHPTSPASAHQHCFATEAEAQLFIEMMGNCKWDKIVEIAD